MKKIRFALKMGDGVEVRNLDELRENFSLPRILEYADDGRLATWLRNSYENEKADLIENLNEDAPNYYQKILEILGVSRGSKLEEAINNFKISDYKKGKPGFCA